VVAVGQLVGPEEVEARLLELAQFGACGATGVCRTVYSPAWVGAQQRLADWGEAAGLAVRQDAVGNLWTRLEGTAAGPVIATGSHLDSQVPGGRYDGVFGALAGTLALAALRARYGQPRRTLEAIAFCEEEGSRFPSSNWWGSRAITGEIGPEEPETVTSADGETIGAAMRAVGLDPDRIPEAKRDDIGDFLELHIEQGPILEHAGYPVGIVQGIPGIRHYEVEVVGRTDHAGGVPMDLRRDALAAAAEIIHRAGATARSWGRPAVTTTGRLEVEPNLAAAIPGRVVFTLDARHPDPEQVRELWAGHEALIAEVAAMYDVAASWRLLVDHDPGPSDPGLVALLEETAAAEGIRALPMFSGGGHDTQQMGRIARTAMIFVPSKDGRSHTPAEYTAPEHLADGLHLLTAALYRLAY
jgi:allantoate deiminase